MSNDSSKLTTDKSQAVNGDGQAARWAWHPVQVVSLTVLLFILSQLLAFVVAYGSVRLFGLARGVNSLQVDLWFDSDLVRVATVLISELAVAGGAMWLYRRHRLTLADLGLGRWPLRNDAFMTLMAFMAYTAVSIGGTALIKILLPQAAGGQQDLGFSNTDSIVTLAMIFAALAVFAPFGEEILFRGFLFGGLRRRLKWLPAAIITSLLFGAAHLAGGSQGFAAPLWSAGYDTLVLSFALCYLREKTGSLWAGIFLHMLKNGLAFILVFIIHYGA